MQQLPNPRQISPTGDNKNNLNINLVAHYSSCITQTDLNIQTAAVQVRFSLILIKEKHDFVGLFHSYMSQPFCFFYYFEDKLITSAVKPEHCVL